MNARRSLQGRRPRGIALITAMLVMALAAIAAAAVLGSAQAAIRRSATLIDGEKAWWYADGVESWVLSILARDLKNGQVDSLDEDWAQKIPGMPVDQGGLQGEILDLQGRFNLNNLGTSDWQTYAKQFQLMFRYIEGLDPSQAPAIAESIHDWIDDNSIPTGRGGEDDYYQGLDQPYRAGNRWMSSPSELLAVKGMTADIYRALAPLVATLPMGTNATRATPINANTASFPVLMSLDPNMDETAVKNWTEVNRAKTPAQGYPDVQKALNLPASVKPDQVSVNTEFFLMKAAAFIGSGRVTLYSVIRRPSSGQPQVISRSLDTE